MTTDTMPVDGASADAPAPPLAPPADVMWSISQIAERDQVSKQAVSKSVKKLAADHGLTVERNGRGHIVKVHVVEFDRLREKLGNASKAQAPAPTAPRAPETGGDSYNEALRQKTWHEAERRRLELDELKRELLRTAAVVEAVGAAGEIIADIFARLPNQADDWAAVVARDGAHGLRLAITAEVNRVRNEIADALKRAVANLTDAPVPVAGEVPQPV